MICDTPSEEVEKAFRIGNTLIVACQVDLSQLVTKSKFNTFRNKNFFYELFLVDFDGSLIDIPVLVTNI